jgi:hypothetical protein
MRRNEVRRSILAAALLLTVAGMTTGCGLLKRNPTFEVIMEASGTQAKKITYAAPYGPGPDEDKREPQKADLTDQALPWKRGLVTKAGEVTLTVAPTDGAATCRIVVENKQVDKQQGQPGAPVTCRATVKGSDG